MGIVFMLERKDALLVGMVNQVLFALIIGIKKIKFFF